MTTSHHDQGGRRAVPGDGWRRIQCELVELLAPTGHPLPPVEADDRVLWVRVDHRRGVLRIHPRTAQLARPELHYTLAAALVELAHGPPPVWARWHPHTGLGTAAATAVAAVAAAVGLLPAMVASALAVITVVLLATGHISTTHRRNQTARLLEHGYRPPTTPARPPEHLDHRSDRKETHGELTDERSQP